MRGKHSAITIEQKQLIHDTWLANANVTIDCRNGMDVVTMEKSKYMSYYGGIDAPAVTFTTRKLKES